jgi:hypothetical protein
MKHSPWDCILPRLPSRHTPLMGEAAARRVVGRSDRSRPSTHQDRAEPPPTHRGRTRKPRPRCRRRERTRSIRDTRTPASRQSVSDIRRKVRSTGELPHLAPSRAAHADGRSRRAGAQSRRMHAGAATRARAGRAETLRKDAARGEPAPSAGQCVADTRVRLAIPFGRSSDARVTVSNYTRRMLPKS